jgi:hypothetical protein
VSAPAIPISVHSARRARVVYRYEEGGDLVSGARWASRVWIDGPWVHVYDDDLGDPDSSVPVHTVLAVEWRDE